MDQGSLLDTGGSADMRCQIVECVWGYRHGNICLWANQGMTLNALESPHHG